MKLPHYMLRGYVSTDAVQFLGNTDNICENYHPLCTETYLICMNKITYLAYKISYKLQNCCHRSYILSKIHINGQVKI